MRRPLHLATYLLVAAAVLLSGCGSTKKTSTTGTASTGASAAQNVPRGTSTKEPHHGKKGVTPKAPEATPEQKQAAAEAEAGRRIVRKRQANERAAARIGLKAAEADLPLKRRYPKELQGKFMLACKAAKGSTSSCECILVRQEANLKVERGQTLAELLALELAFAHEHASLEDIRRRRVRSPRLVRRVVRECK